ncbi:heavy metal translocating P-type ATPase metal-binding domain-containing protein [Campylobacter sp. MIT 21-1685]|uniref:heavy metal translocating P-type ATPase n=1 Tax=unclassified Campylobacter TaxID=2593542 RepID=UPI00224B4354|nr:MULTISPECIES: heavy metal translocating P-type ATPase [unclassified Campylobacter]MCX2683684.1 heavy metal translocating P-type ATPase metal-binding domain-containing protein [Campylobacter sp. MIT 21-1684]MCX2751969.1 heavy metal translocating P-type ATPase metal-binding domain-containing protein [Campylobacter sp. MIT 21-1682]MCX2808169.1 heavy metal translocating P-type ATPase metal-binding domain-containing protein [Campylobacter sp. MIT 21-1685]
MKCMHCRLDFAKENMREFKGNFFCCLGCQNVYEIINEYGLQEFYQKLSIHTLNPVNTNKVQKNYDSFIRQTQEGFSEIYLVIHGIECSACVWLNEKILIKQEGILELDINTLTHKARIVFDGHCITLDQILNLIESIGYKASAYNPLKEEEKTLVFKRQLYSKLIVALACVMNIMWIAVAKYAGFFSGMQQDIKDILNFAEFILCAPVLFYTGSSFYKSAFVAIKNRSLNMDTLVISGTSLTFIYSLWAMFFRVGEVYFDSVAMIICFVFIGKYLELLSKKHALDTVDGLNDFLQNEVLVFNGKEFVPKEVQKIESGELILLRSGDKIVIDGICERGQASIDTSSLNGESQPLLAQKDTLIYSACIVLDGTIEYRTLKNYEDSTLSQIIKLLEFAGLKKTRLQSLVSKLASSFSRTILSLSFLCFCLWYFYFKVGFESSLINALSVLIIACPCALALATPVSTLIALSKALKKQILFKHSDFIEDLSKCDMAVFDKTGVLTQMKLQPTQIYTSQKLSFDELYHFTKLSQHPIAQNVSAYAKQKVKQNVQFDFDEFHTLAAKGIKAKYRGIQFLGGNIQFLRENGIVFSKEFENSHFLFAKGGEILAFFEFENILRKGAKELIEYLKTQKIVPMIASGDNEKAVQKIAKELEITAFESSCLPQRKMELIEELSGKHKLLFVGDGVNDSLALKYAAVSVSLKEGSDLAIENSDIILLKNDLASLQYAIILAKKTYKIIQQNLAFSLLYNVCTLPLSFLGLINPLIAALSMSFSSIIVLLNALRIKND